MNFQKSKVMLLLLIIILVFSGCRAIVSEPQSGSYRTEDIEFDLSDDLVFEVKDQSGAPIKNAVLTTDSLVLGGVFTQQSETNNKVIKTGELSLEVINLDQVVQEVIDLVAANSGFVQSSSRRDHENFNRVNMVIRVPAENFSEVHSALADFGDVKVDNTNTQDVTEEYLDMEVRLTTLEAKRESFTKLLDKAESVSDILKIENELNKVIYDIESLKGKMQYLDRQVAMSTITLSITEKNPVSSFKSNYSERFNFALQDGWGSMLNFIMSIVLTVVWLLPFAPFVFLIIFLAVKLWRKIKVVIAKRREKAHLD